MLRRIGSVAWRRAVVSQASLRGSATAASCSAPSVWGVASRSRRWLSMEAREAMDFDVVVVGAGPAGLSAAIRLKQLNEDANVCVVEKGAEVGSHILSGNVFDPKALTELIPDWKEKEAPLDTPVTSERFRFLTEKSSFWLPTPPDMQNHGNYIISLGSLCRWLASEAEELGVEVYPGFSASELLFTDESKTQVAGIATSDMGVGKDGKPKDTFARGMELRAKHTLLAEGVRGSLSEEAMRHFDLRKDCETQTYGLGLKEVWEIDPEKHKSGHVEHAMGWPLSSDVYGGSFLYHMDPNLVLIGFVVGLDYANPYLSPYEEFQRFKQHPEVRSVLEGGQCISYGARAINEGGIQSIPKLTFPGGALLGCSAGFLNVPKIKGSHYAIKSGMLAAEAIHEAGEDATEITAYSDAVANSWIHKELNQVRNMRPAFEKGRLFGMAVSGVESYVLRGRAPYTLKMSHSDAEATKKAAECEPIEYPKPDGKISFDLLTNLQRSGVYHDDDQPSHLKIKPELAHVPESVSYQEFGAPESRFCPAKVYEYTTDENGENPKLVINAQNCVHCKTCSIKTPFEFINWTVPEGGGGPNYENM